MWYSTFFGPFNPLDCMGAGKGTQAKRTQFANNMELQNTLVNKTNEALTVYEWSGLEDTMDERMLEMSFLFRGCAMVANIDGSLYTLFANPSSALTVYGYPVKAWGTGFNGYNKEFALYVRGADEGKELTALAKTITPVSRDYDAVYGIDNPSRYPYMNYIINSSLRLANIKRAEDVVRENMKLPAVITAEESQIRTIRDTLRKREENEAAIVLSVGNNVTDSIKVWDLKVNPTALKELAEAYERENDYLKGIFGLNANPNTDKKERLLTSEIDANNEETQLEDDVRLIWRKRFAEDVNAAFGTSISVKRRIEPSEREVNEDDELQRVSGQEPDNA